MVDEHFADIPGGLAVYDDITVGGKTLEEHDKALKLVLDRARERNIKFNRSKVQLRVNQVKYLGHIISADGFRPDPSKIKANIHLQKGLTKTLRYGKLLRTIYSKRLRNSNTAPSITTTRFTMGVAPKS
jgi:hypothetical protein